MNHPLPNMTQERRDHIRRLARDDIALICGDEELLARLSDLSPSGLQFEIDGSELNRVKDDLHSVRLKGFPALGIDLVWSLDDSFGARFTEAPELVEAVVDQFLNAPG